MYFMYRTELEPELVPTYRVARGMRRDKQSAFEDLGELGVIGKEEMGIRVLAKAGMVSVDIIKPTEAFDLQYLGVHMQDAIKKIEKAKESIFLGDLQVNLQPTVEVYEEGRETRIGIPVTPESAMRLNQEREKLVDILHGSNPQKEYVQEWTPNVTIGLIDHLDVKNAGVLAVIAKDILGFNGETEEMETSIVTYPVLVRNAYTKVVMR